MSKPQNYTVDTILIFFIYLLTSYMDQYSLTLAFHLQVDARFLLHSDTVGRCSLAERIVNLMRTVDDL